MFNACDPTRCSNKSADFQAIETDGSPMRRRLLLIYASVYGMVRTTVYLTEELKQALERVARAQQRSEAQLIREGVRQILEHYAPTPKVPLFNSGQPDLAERADELLEGFGER